MSLFELGFAIYNEIGDNVRCLSFMRDGYSDFMPAIFEKKIVSFRVAMVN